MDDDEMLKLLRQALADGGGNDEVPAAVVAAAVAAGGWLRLDDELAELVADSADEPVAPGVRGTETGGYRQLSYELDDRSVDCELLPDGLLGQITPAGGVTLSVVTPDGTERPMPLDRDGRFLLRPLPGPTFALRCTRPGRPAVLTPWVLC
jgi:hypothetical protein